jgi:hypothetical protein
MAFRQPSTSGDTPSLIEQEGRVRSTNDLDKKSTRPAQSEAAPVRSGCHFTGALYGCSRRAAVGGCGRCLAALFAWGSIITNTGFGANTGEAAVVKPPSDIAE